jgi:hypothetical protein
LSHAPSSSCPLLPLPWAHQWSAYVCCPSLPPWQKQLPPAPPTCTPVTCLPCHPASIHTSNPLGYSHRLPPRACTRHVCVFSLRRQLSADHLYSLHGLAALEARADECRRALGHCHFFALRRLLPPRLSAHTASIIVCSSQAVMLHRTLPAHQEDDLTAPHCQLHCESKRTPTTVCAHLKTDLRRRPSSAISDCGMSLCPPRPLLPPRRCFSRLSPPLLFFNGAFPTLIQMI